MTLKEASEELHEQEQRVVAIITTRSDISPEAKSALLRGMANLMGAISEYCQITADELEECVSQMDVMR